MKKIKINLLVKVLIAILGGIVLGQFMPGSIIRLFVTFNSLFANFLSFAIPLIIVGLVAPAIGELGRGAGKLLAITALLAYGSTLFSGFFTYFSCDWIFPNILPANTTLFPVGASAEPLFTPYFEVAMPPIMDVMTALLLSFTIGLGLSYINGHVLKDGFNDFKEIVVLLIEVVIIPLLPLHIFGIFLNMTASGQVFNVISMFLKVIVVIFVLHILILLIQFTVAGIVSRKNPLRLLQNMLEEYRYFCYSLVCHDSSCRQHHENRCLRDGDYVHDCRAGNAMEFERIHLHVGDSHGCRTGRSGRSDYGGVGIAPEYVRFRRNPAGADDSALYCDG